MSPPDRRLVELPSHVLPRLLGHVHEVFWVLSVELDQVNYVSPSYEKVWGYSCQSLYDNPYSWADPVHPDDRERLHREAFEQPIQEGVAIEYRIIRPDGAVRWIRTDAIPVNGPDGKLEYLAGVSDDVTDQHEAAAALKASEERLAQAFEHAPFPTMIHAEDDTIVLLNRAWEELSGYDRDELPTLSSWVERAHGGRQRLSPDVFAAIHETGEKVDWGEMPIRTRDRGERICHFTSAPLGTLPDGRRLLIAMGIDLTERKLAESRRQWLASIVESTDDAVIGTATDGTVTSWNAGAERLFGMQADEIMGQDIAAKTIPPHRHHEVGLIIRRLARGESIRGYETVRKKKDGTRFDASLTISLVRDTDGWHTGLAIIARDISEQRRAEKLFRHAVEAAPSAMLMVDESGIVRFVNTQAEATLGYSRDELLGSPVTRFVPAAERARHPEFVSRFFGEFRPRTMGDGRDLFAVKSDGTEIPVEIGLNPVETEAGRMVLTSLHDISERRRWEQEITERNRELEALLHVTSHDLREPLRSIEQFSGIVHDRHAGHLGEEGQDYLMRVVRAAQRMRALLDDLLRLSRARRVVQPDRPIAAGELVEEALERLGQRIEESSAHVVVAPGLPELNVDRTWGVEALYNLISNALKFTADGKQPEVLVESFTATSVDTGGRAVGLAVCDRGPGIDPRYADRIFELFQRAVGREVEGTGAGLAIVRTVAERHGGRAWVEAREGGGSRFVICFEKAREQHAE